MFQKPNIHYLSMLIPQKNIKIPSKLQNVAKVDQVHTPRVLTKQQNMKNSIFSTRMQTNVSKCYLN